MHRVPPADGGEIALANFSNPRRVWRAGNDKSMKLVARIPTELGPRTTVQQGLSPNEASALARAIEAQGGAACVIEDGHVLSLAARMHKRKQDKARAAAKKPTDDMTHVVVLPQRQVQ
jgi:hypothetical protein